MTKREVSKEVESRAAVRRLHLRQMITSDETYLTADVTNKFVRVVVGIIIHEHSFRHFRRQLHIRFED